MVVYETINKINGKRYIGKDKHNDPKYLGSGRLLQKAIKKYGKENFVKTILEYCSSEAELAEKERHWIQITNAQTSNLYYNIGEGGIGGDNITSNPNRDLFIQRVKLNRATHIEQPHSEETKENQRKAAIGRYTLEWFCSRYGDTVGKEKYEERNKKLKERNMKGENNPASRKVMVDGVVYPTIRATRKAFNGSTMQTIQKYHMVEYL
jgi:group I intron endonuclease